MNRAVIVVRTANRPEILNRCIAAAVDGCGVAREAHWVVLDDSSPDGRPRNHEIAQFWKGFGLGLTYVDKTVEEKIADSLPGATLRRFFAHLVASPSSRRSERGRNLGLLTGLSLNPDVLFLVDDDMVHRHQGNCFLHWCANVQRADSFVAAPRKLGISDMTYLNRLVAVLNRDDWGQFVSDAGISADPESWYSPSNPLWKRGDDGSDGAPAMLNEREILSGGLMALCGRGVEWLPFPSGYNEDVNWSFLQSSFRGTALLKVSGVHAQHLPPCIGHPKGEAIMAQVVGTAITRAIRQIKPCGEQSMSTLADRLPDVLGVELRREVFLFLDVERAIHFRARMCTDDVHAGGTLSKIESTLVDVAERLKSVDSRQLAGEWLNDLATRRKMFLALRRNERVQMQISRVLFDPSV
jgi:hypothetical protein